MAGLAPIIVHDLKRSAVRNMMRARILKRVATSLSGHKTREVLNRYKIVSGSELGYGDGETRGTS